MDAGALLEQIRRYEAQIRELCDDNSRLRDKIARLEKAAQGYRQRQSAFESYVVSERAKTEQVKGLSKIRIAESFAASLSEDLNGPPTAGASESFLQIGKRIADEREMCEDEIDTNNKSIQAFEREISYLRSRIAALA